MWPMTWPMHQRWCTSWVKGKRLSSWMDVHHLGFKHYLCAASFDFTNTWSLYQSWVDQPWPSYQSFWCWLVPFFLARRLLVYPKGNKTNFLSVYLDCRNPVDSEENTCYYFSLILANEKDEKSITKGRRNSINYHIHAHRGPKARSLSKLVWKCHGNTMAAPNHAKFSYKHCSEFLFMVCLRLCEATTVAKRCLSLCLLQKQATSFQKKRWIGVSPHSCHSALSRTLQKGTL